MEVNDWEQPSNINSELFTEMEVIFFNQAATLQ